MSNNFSRCVRGTKRKNKLLKKYVEKQTVERNEEKLQDLQMEMDSIKKTQTEKENWKRKI